MAANEGFQATADALNDPGIADSDLARPLLDVLPVDGIAISTLGEVLGSETISASDSRAERLDEIQFDLSEGPCWIAMATGRPVLTPDWRRADHALWPTFAHAVEPLGIGAMFAFPLSIGTLRFGAIDCFTDREASLSDVQIGQADALSKIVGRVVLRRALSAADETAVEERRSRRVVQQATGMVVAQLRLLPEDALLLIQGQAFSTGRTVTEISSDILARRLRFGVDGEGIETMP
jgi:hypothetical protein